MLNKHGTPHKFTINQMISCGTETNSSAPIWSLQTQVQTAINSGGIKGSTRDQKT